MRKDHGIGESFTKLVTNFLNLGWIWFKHDWKDPVRDPYPFFLQPAGTPHIHQAKSFISGPRNGLGYVRHQTPLTSGPFGVSVLRLQNCSIKISFSTP
jgi:hypothetical protein